MHQRSSQNPWIVLWLFVAATACVDAVALFWTTQNEFHVFSEMMFLGLAYGQLSGLCVWAINSHRTVGLRWTVPFVAGLGIGLFAADLDRPGRFGVWEHNLAHIAMSWAHVVVALVAMWLFKMIGLLHNNEAKVERDAWRFSIKNLMVLMTVSAVLLALFARNRLLNDVWSDAWGSVLSLYAGNVAILIAAMSMRQLGAHRLLRLAAVFAVALVIGAVWEWADFAFGDGLNTTIAFYLIQAFVVWAWLEVLPFEAAARCGSVDASDSTETAKQSTI